MENKLENVELTALTMDEQIEINGGTGREDPKQKNMFDLLWAIIAG